MGGVSVLLCALRGRAPVPGQFGRGEDESQFTVKFVKLLKRPLDQLHLLLTFSLHLHHKRLDTHSNSDVRAAGAAGVGPEENMFN